MPRLEIKNLSKTYRDGNEALKEFNLALDNGVFGLLGPNGAGKSTLLEILSMNLMPTRGEVYWEGKLMTKRPQKWRALLGYLPQYYGLYPELSSRQTLKYLGRLNGLRGKHLKRRIDTVLDQVGLSEYARDKVGGFSGGMRQRLAIAQAMLHEPPLMVIDEPTTGLDPAERVAFRNLLFDLGQKGIVILSTHIVKDVEFTCQRMAVVYGGIKRFEGRPAEFIEPVCGKIYETERPVEELEAFRAEHGVVAIRELEGKVQIRFLASDDDAGECNAMPEDAQLVDPNLEDAYVNFILETARGEDGSQQQALAEAMAGEAAE